MNREIKFRGKSLVDIGNIKKGDWVYGGIVFDTDRVWIDIPYIGQVLVEKETVGQYTGFHDRFGNEIYEGDIVLLDCYDYEEPLFSGEFKVIYDEEKGMWLLVDLENKDRDFTFGEIKGYYKAEIEVIGNIYDNPELLGGE